MRYMFSSVNFFNFKNYLIIEYVYGDFLNAFSTFLTHSSPLPSPVSLSQWAHSYSDVLSSETH